MAKDPASENDRASPQRPRRKAVTIDLAAAEVGRKPGEGPSSAASSAAEAGAAAASASTSEKPDITEPPNVAPDKAPPPAKDGGRTATDEPTIPSAFGSRTAEGRDASKAARSEGAPVEQPAAGGGRVRSFAAFLFATLVGGAIAAVVVIVLARAGYLFPASDDKTVGATSSDIAALTSEVAALKASGAALAPLKEQIAALQKSVGEFSRQAPVSSVDPAALKALQDRLAALESAPPPTGSSVNLEPRLAALAQDIATLKSAAPPDTASLQSDVAGLHQQLDTLAANIEKLPNEERVAAIEAKLAETDGRLGETNKIIDSAKVLAPAVAADALQAALDAGRPFESELAALKNLGVDAATIGALAPQAKAGLPTIADLSARFDQVIASIPLETPIPENTGAIDRLLQSAQGLVSVRPAHPVAGNDPGAIVARIRGALATGDLKSALAEWDTLPDTIKTPTADWAKLAKTRVEADHLAAEVRSAALAKLSAGK